MASKLRIRVGNIELEYEGEAAFTPEGIKDLFSHIESLFKTSPTTLSGPSEAAAVTDTKVGATSASALSLHINSVAAKLNVDSGPDLALAAAAHLQIIEKRQSFTRQDLLERMQEATLYYKASHSNNLTRTLEKLVGSEFNQLSGSQYSLTASAMKDLEAKIADG